MTWWHQLNSSVAYPSFTQLIVISRVKMKFGRKGIFTFWWPSWMPVLIQTVIRPIGMPHSLYDTQTAFEGFY